MNLHQKLVAQFHKTMGAPVADRLTVPSIARRRLRVALIAEELKELADSLGVPFSYSVGPEWCVSIEVDMVNAAREVADLDVVVQGTNVEMGVVGDAVFFEVMRANNAKAPGGVVRRREDGKILKPDDWQPPRVEMVLRDCEAFRTGGQDLYQYPVDKAEGWW